MGTGGTPPARPGPGMGMDRASKAMSALTARRDRSASGGADAAGSAGFDGSAGPVGVESLRKEQQRLQTQLRANYMKLQAAEAAMEGGGAASVG